MQTLVKYVILMVSGLLALSGCTAMTALLPPAVQPTEASPAATVDSLTFYNSYASW